MFWLRNKKIIFLVRTLNLRPEHVKPIIKVYATAIKNMWHMQKQIKNK